MEFTAAVVKEQRVTFAVVLVKSSAANPSNRDATQREAGRLFPGLPIILCSQNGNGTPSYYGRRDIVQFLANVSMDRLPWKKYHSQAA